MDAALIAISVVNVVLMVWLGLTVLLNAERRTWGVWLTGAALLFGGAFFLAQAAAAGSGPSSGALAFYAHWPLGWFIGMALPLAWYATILWYAGYWEDRATPLRHRHRLWLPLVAVLAAVVLALAALALAPRWTSVARSFTPFAHPALGNVPVLVLLYPILIVLCIALSLDVLAHPEPSSRLMGDLARRRARPWLVATSAVLLLVSLLVGAMMVDLALPGTPPLLPGATHAAPWSLVWGELITSALVTLAVLLLGQAIMAYEIFSGVTLPRRGLRRQWLGAVLLAFGYGALTGWTVSLERRPFVGLLAATLLLGLFYALFSWRSYLDREGHLRRLRPFTSAPQIFETLLDPGAAELQVGAPFYSLCADLLTTRAAYLIPVGPLSALAGPPLAYPSEAAVPPHLVQFRERCTSPEALCLPLDPGEGAGAVWLVPLWSGRGLLGLLFLGEKSAGGLYTQEEMEIARASGERYLDTLACARMAQRLALLQRQRLAETRVGDRRARRLLHDEALPRLHAAMLKLGELPSGVAHEAVEELTQVHRELAILLREMPTATDAQIGELGLIGALRRLVQDEFAEDFEGVTWEVEPEAETRAAALPPLTAEVVLYAAREALRNAARHGRGDNPARPLHMTLAVRGREGLQITLTDDGVGLAVAPATSGTGQGLALHSTLMAVIGGGWGIESTPGEFTEVTLSVPDSGR
jgi:signal transduction histidine kinase